MSRAFDALMKELGEEENTTPEQTTDTAPEQTPEEPKPEETPAEPPKEEPAPEETPAEPPKEEPKPEETPAEPPKKPSDYSPEERAQHAFSRQLAKEREKHARELAEMKESFQKQLDELKSASKPKEPLKTRADFPADKGGDDEYIKYLANKQVQEIMAERDAKQAEHQAEIDKQKKEQEAAEAELAERQREWISNVDSAFKDDANRKDAFLKRVKYCSERGLDSVLDNSPVASEFLLAHPLVFEAILNDRSKFERVFNERDLSPMNQFYNLKKIEEELDAPAQPTQTAPAPNPVPHLGKPGKQAASSTQPDIFTDERAMRSFLRSGH